MKVQADKQPKKSRFAYGSLYRSMVTPRFWHGMTISSWLRQLKKHPFSVSLPRIPLTLGITLFAMGNSVLRYVQENMYGTKANRLSLREPPIFIIGHWRSGTTMLHEMMVQDEHFTCPTTYQCFSPHHFLLTENFVTRWLSFVMPSQRPMDNMTAGWSKPQEDEFALCNMGNPSPYLNLLFPNHELGMEELIDVELLSEEAREKWKADLMWFLQRVQIVTPHQMVLKSPPHTGRVKVLLEAYPDAKFIHISRDPYSIFPSTTRLWKELNFTQAIQLPNNRNLEDYVLDYFECMYSLLDRDRHLLNEENFYEIRYEDLVKNPIDEIRNIYAALQLGDFEKMLPNLQQYLDGVKNYRTNTHSQIDPEIQQKIAVRWANYIERYGYEKQLVEK